MLFNLSEKVSRTAYKGLYLVKEYAPEEFAVLGIAAGLGALYFAIKDTKKEETKQILEKHKQSIDDIHEVHEKASKEDSTVTYTEEQRKRDLAVVYTRTATSLAKAYWKTILLESVSIACTVKGTKSARFKINNLAASLAVSQNLYNKYRKNVIDKYGKEIDDELRHGVKAETIKYKDEYGNIVEKKEKVTSITEEDRYDISRLFDETNPKWVNNAEYNNSFIKGVAAEATRILKNRGFLWLNDVYRMLGFEETEFGHEIGWVYKDKTKEDVLGHSNIVEIKPIVLSGKPATDFLEGYEPSVLLTFNVDGYIRDQIVWAKK